VKTCFILIFVALNYCVSSVASAQMEERVESGDSTVLLSVWEGGLQPTQSVVLVPGWGGGPHDVLGLAEFLSSRGVPVVVLTPRGWHAAGGASTFANALDDIGSAVKWARSKFENDVVLGGHSWGGGMALAYAARDTSIQRTFSIAGTDHGQFIRQYQADPTFAAMVDQILTETSAPVGPIRFDVEYGLQEMANGQSIYGLVENADRLAGRSILLIGGWEDMNVTVDETLLPLYRALGAAGAAGVTFHVYHDNHAFLDVRPQLQHAILEWMGQ